ncbi:MAG: alcohol dehydrogenase, partial [Chloroflexi bacterium]
CSPCRRGKPNCCENIRVLGIHTDGGMREQIVVPLDKLHRSDVLTLDQLALVEPMGIGAHAVRRAALTPGENVLVIGAGPIGLATLLSAQMVGATVMMMDISQNRLTFCREQMGVEHVIDGKDEPAARIRDLLDGELPTAVFDATGSPFSMMNAYKYVAHGGKLIFVGVVPGELTFPDPEIHSRELTIYRTRNATDDDFAWVVQMLETGQIHPERWITHRAGPEKLVADFANWLNPDYGVVKALLEL